MYTVVICTNCEYPLTVKDDPETTKCQRCRTQLKFRKLKAFFQSESLQEAKHARASIAAQMRGFGETFDAMNLDIDTDAVNERINEEYLSAQGLSKDDISRDADGEKPPNRSRPEIVEDAVVECDPATESAIHTYAEDHGVPGDKALEILARMYERGDVIMTGDAYRLV